MGKELHFDTYTRYSINIRKVTHKGGWVNRHGIY